MSRIRSVHPGLWTDERFVSVTMPARLLMIGIWNECDDKGLFEWSPLKLKMRLMPADAVDAAQLLAELASAGLVAQYEVAGRSFGAVRNFGKWQRPKKPNAVHPAPDHMLAFASGCSAPVPHPFPTPPEKPEQRKEEGGRIIPEADASGQAPPAAQAPGGAIDFCKAVFDSGRAILTRSGMDGRQAGSLIGRWRKKLGDPELLTLIRQSEADGHSDPAAWLSAAVEKRNAPDRSRRGAIDRQVDGFTSALRRATAELEARDLG